MQGLILTELPLRKDLAPLWEQQQVYDDTVLHFTSWPLFLALVLTKLTQYLGY
jgi:hypothetical protein